MPDVPVKSLRKALDLLSALAFGDPDGAGLELTVLARRFGLPANTAHNLLKTMVVCGYVAQNAAGRYTIGPQCRRLGVANHVESDKFKEQLLAILNRHGSELNEGMVFTKLNGGKRVVLARYEPERQAIRVAPQDDAGVNALKTPTGRALFAFASEEERRQMLERYGPPEANWPNQAADLVLIRRDGLCAILPDPSGIDAFAIPVFDAAMALLGAVGCHAPAFRCDQACQAHIVATLRQAAAELGAI